MKREQFIERYMTASGLLPYTVDGEVVTFQEEGCPPCLLYALPCKCGEYGCEGWAMVPNGSQNWHKFQNDLTDMTFHQATAADAAIRRKEG